MSIRNENITAHITPTHAGQVVRDQHLRKGITTDAPRSRTPQISVQFVGGPYPVLVPIDELEVIDLPAI